MSMCVIYEKGSHSDISLGAAWDSTNQLLYELNGFKMICVSKNPQLNSVCAGNGDTKWCSHVGHLPAWSELTDSLRLEKSGTSESVLQRSKEEKVFFFFTENHIFFFKLLSLGSAYFFFWFICFVSHTSYLTKVHLLHVGHHLCSCPAPILLILSCILIYFEVGEPSGAEF